VFGVWLISCASVGYFQRHLTPLMRLLFAAAGLAALIPAEAFSGGTLLDIVGVGAGIAVMVYEYMDVSRLRATAAAKLGGPRA
jgi:hypothetical protein